MAPSPHSVILTANCLPGWPNWLHKVVAAYGRWSVRGCVVAGTGADASKVEQYTQEDLDVWDFSLTDDDMAALNALGA